MPTGYTAPVQDGTITELSDFALICARAFGAMVLLRDSDQSLEATRRFIAEGAYAESSSYYEERLTEARARLDALLAMNDADALAAAQAERDSAEEREREREEKRLRELARYETMIAKVKAWPAPTTEHERFKDFMLDQLRSSIDFDCRPFSMPLPEVSLAWRDTEIEREVASIARCEEEIAKERERNDGRRAWITALIDSLEAVPA